VFVVAATSRELVFALLSILSWLLSTLSIFPYRNQFLHDTVSPFMSRAATEALPSLPDISHENLLFDYPEADVILRSRDSYEFRVLKIYIVHSSPVLGEKVLVPPIPQPKPTSPTIAVESDVDSEDAANAFQVPVVQLPIDGAILFSLLTYIFPVPPVLPSAVEQVMELLSVAQMYKMDVVLTHIRNHIAQQEPPFIREETAFLIYSLSQKHALRTEALQAARCTLSFSSLTIQDLAEEHQLDIMPGNFLYELWQYHQRVRSNLALDLDEFKKSTALTVRGDSICESLADSGLPHWLDSYISGIGTARVPAFLDLADFHTKLIEHIERQKLDGGCASCSDMSGKEIWKALTAVVHGSIVKVRVIYVVAPPQGPEPLYRLRHFFHFLLRNRGLKVEPAQPPLLHRNIQICPMQISSSGPPTLSISVSIDRCWLLRHPF
jgi:hypothetical protein